MRYLKAIPVFLFGLLFLNCSTAKVDALHDGSTVEKAIKVGSVDEEYQIMRKLCPDCRLVGQSLVPKGNKHYDVIDLVRPNGEKVVYWFDINSFYGNF